MRERTTGRRIPVVRFLWEEDDGVRFSAARPMKVYSWNVFYSNERIEDVFDAIHELDFDVLCLQEVPETLLARLKKTSLHLAYSTDAVRKEDIVSVPIYLVILSRHPFLREGSIALVNPPRTLQMKLFIALNPLGWTFVTGRTVLYVDVPLENGTIRIASLHLSTHWGAANRRKEFMEVVERIGTSPLILCGDFNIIEWGPIKLLNWLLGGHWKEAVPWYPERALIEERFTELGFKNLHRGMVTHPFSRSQLDHIVISKALVADTATVHAERHGSDHCLISANITRAR